MNIPKDKQMHFVAGAIIFNFSIPISYLLGVDSIVFGSILTLIGALGKEVFDFIHNDYLIRRNQKPKHSVEFMDFIATMLGAVPSIILIMLMGIL